MSILIFGIARARGDGGVRTGDRRHDAAASDIRRIRYYYIMMMLKRDGVAQRRGPNRIRVLVSDL